MSALAFPVPLDRVLPPSQPRGWRLWRARRHYRAELRRLLRDGVPLLADIGLPLAEARAEAAKPFWRP